jgi:poly-beta-1,6-N-acetyl-D-glucosamine N-deacetylase
MIWMIVCVCLLLLIVALQHQGVPVMLFHQVNKKSNTHPDELEQYFSYLKSNNYNTHTLAEIDALFAAQHKIPKKSVLLTFDDGYADNYTIVFPLLKKYNLKAVFFVNTLFIKDTADRSEISYEHSDTVNTNLIQKYFNQQDPRSEQYITWAEMAEMEASGLVDIQCHSHRHGMVFSTSVFKNVIRENDFVSAGDYFVHNGKPIVGAPLFKMRGELSNVGLKIDVQGLELFKKQFNETEAQVISKKKRKAIYTDFFTADFVGKHIQAYSQAEFKSRVDADISTNKSLIDAHLNKDVKAFAWPYGHNTTDSVPWMQALGIQYFFTCKKGTNTRTFKKEYIYRMELRKATAKKLIFITKINSNLALGWIYRWLS